MKDTEKTAKVIFMSSNIMEQTGNQVISILI